MHPRPPLVAATALALVLTATASVAPAMGDGFKRDDRNTNLEPAFDQQFRAPLEDSDVDVKTDVIASGLDHPWGIAVLPGDTGYLVSERAGNLRHIARDGTMSEPITGLPEILVERQGGLLDVALAPDFDSSRRIYITYAKPVADGLSATAAAMGRLAEDLGSVEDMRDIFVQSPGSTEAMHYGSRAVFDGAGHVFITTGEHSSQRYRDLAQDLGTTYGKVVRLTEDGEIPQDNPFVGDADAMDEIWSWGHRNIQGAVMRDGTLWTIEHGPQGGDELNRPEPGLNYGWPVISYGESYSGTPIGEGVAQKEGMEQPVYFWDPVIAPAGMISYSGEMFPEWSGDLLISSLFPGGVVRLSLDDAGLVTEEERLVMDLGRVRDIETDRDGSLLVITDFDNGELIRLRR